MGVLAAIPVIGPVLETVKGLAGLGSKGLDPYRYIQLSRERSANDQYRVGTEARRDAAIADGKVDVEFGNLHARLALADQTRGITRSMRPVLFYVCVYRLV